MQISRPDVSTIYGYGDIIITPSGPHRIGTLLLRAQERSGGTLLGETVFVVQSWNVWDTDWDYFHEFAYADDVGKWKVLDAEGIDNMRQYEELAFDTLLEALDTALPEGICTQVTSPDTIHTTTTTIRRNNEQRRNL